MTTVHDEITGRGIMPSHPGLEALGDGFCMLDDRVIVVYWNAAAERMLGVTRDRALGRVWTDVLPASVHPHLAPHLRAVQRDGVPVETAMPHLPGCCAGLFQVRVTATDEAGITMQFRDATDEHRLSERHSRLIESLRDGFVAVDPDGTIGYINQVAERLLRLHRGAALGDPIWTLIPDRPEEIEESLRATLADGNARQLRRVRPDAPVFRDHMFDLWIHPLPGGGLTVLFQDVTRRVQREQELARYAAEAEEANQAKSRFFAAVSHELRTPLNAIVGYTHLLTTDTYGEMPTAATRAAARASVCAEHLSQLVDDLLLMTTAELDRLPVEPQELSLESALPGMLEPLRQQAEAKGLRFSIDVDPDVPSIRTDSMRLRQLLHSLVSNAVKFTSRGDVRIVVDRVAGPCCGNETPGAAPMDGSAPAAVEPGTERERVRIRVVDTGPGVPDEARDRIFEAFEQLGDDSRSDSFRRGPGLGLAVSRRIAVLLRGRISLETTGERGSVFRLDLPLHHPG
jgi:PAS domain S-box-containing protein